MAKSARGARATSVRAAQRGRKSSATRSKSSTVRRQQASGRDASSARQDGPGKPKLPRLRRKTTRKSAPRPVGAAVPAAKGKLERVPLPRQSTKAARSQSTAIAPVVDEGKYVYCVIKSDRPLSFGTLGIGAEPAEVHTVRHRDIAAVVSSTPIVALDPTRDNVLSHQRVNETVMQEHTVLPMSFGTVFKTDDDIIELLRSAYDAFTDVLNKMQDKLEFGLKVLWDRDLIVHEIEAEDEDIRRLKGEISSQKGSTYFARMQYGRLIDAALQSRSERYVSEIFEALRNVSVASRSNKPIGDRMIMNAAFLVSRYAEQAFDARVREIGQRYDKLTFKFTGPWPPYNFVNIRLKLERAH
jgi:gas vesicle protein GvpL/GvpF